MNELKAPKNLLDLLQPEIMDHAHDGYLEISLEFPGVKDDTIEAYFFRFDGKVHAHSDKPALPGKLPQHIKIRADTGESLAACRDKFIPDCLELGYLLAEKDSLVLKLRSNLDGREYPVLNASPSGVLYQPGPYLGWNLLPKESLKKIEELCPK